MFTLSLIKTSTGKEIIVYIAARKEYYKSKKMGFFDIHIVRIVTSNEPVPENMARTFLEILAKYVLS